MSKMNKIMLGLGVFYGILSIVFLVDMWMFDRKFYKEYQEEIESLEGLVDESKQRLRISDSLYYQEMQRLQDEVLYLHEKQAKSKEELARLDSMRGEEVLRREQIKEALLNW